MVIYLISLNQDREWFTKTRSWKNYKAEIHSLFLFKNIIICVCCMYVCNCGWLWLPTSFLLDCCCCWLVFLELWLEFSSLGPPYLPSPLSQAMASSWTYPPSSYYHLNMLWKIVLKKNENTTLLWWKFKLCERFGSGCGIWSLEGSLLIPIHFLIITTNNTNIILQCGFWFWLNLEGGEGLGRWI